ncbi:MAG: hypothetical protein ACK40Q_08295 [Pseudothermotoga sp.]
MIIERLLKTCFSEEAAFKIVQKVKELYRKQRKTSDQDLHPIKSELADIEKKLNNWIDALGEGLLDKTVLAEKIKEANQRKVVLESELHRTLMMNTTPDIDDKSIKEVLYKKRDLLYSSNEEERKQVIQEFVEMIIVLPSDDNDPKDKEPIKIDMKVRLFTGVTSGAPYR